MTVELPFHARPGSLFDIDELRHVLSRIDPDGKVFLRRCGAEKIFKVAGPDGFPTEPDAAALLDLMAADRVVLVADPPPDETAAARRVDERDAAAARALDPTSDLRVAFLRAYDENPSNLSIAALWSFWDSQLHDPRFRALACAHPKAVRKGRRIAPWRPCDKTLRDWIATRGGARDRQQRDCISLTGRGDRELRIDHPPEILAHWLAQTHANRRDIKKNHDGYSTELIRISRGDPTGREDETGEPVTYPKPTRPHVAITYNRFWRLVQRTRGRDASLHGRGGQAAEAEYGGGGRMEAATQVGAIGKFDDTPAPVLCKVVAGGVAWVGTPTVTMLHDDASKGLYGSDISWDPPSSSTVLRTIADASTPKRVPKDMAKKHPQLAMFCCKFDRLVCDNLAAHHGRHVEDACRENYIDLDFTGSRRPRDKADTESEIGKLLALAFKGLPCAVDAIPLRRHAANDPPIEHLPTIDELRPLLNRAMAVKNVSPASGLLGGSPLSALLRSLGSRKLNVIKDMRRFRQSIGMVEYEVEMRSAGIKHFTILRFVQPGGSNLLFEKLRHLERPSKRRKVPSVRVKIKYDASDIGEIHVWDPIDKRYVTFVCDRPSYATGMPKWLHERILRDIAEGERETCSEADLVEYRARLFEEQSRITQDAAEDERRRAANLVDTEIFKRVMGRFVEVRHEDDEEFAPAPDPESLDHGAEGRFSSETSLDATVPTPRAAPGATRGGPAPRRSARGGDDSTRERGGRRPPAEADDQRRPPRPRSPANASIKWS